MDLPLSQERSRGWLRASLYLFCLLVPLSIAGANISWSLVLASLVAVHASNSRLDWRPWRSALEFPLWIYLATAVVSAALGVDPANSFRHLNQDAHKVWICLLFSIALAAEPAPAAWGWLAAGFGAAGLIGLSQVRIPPESLHMEWDWVRAHAFVHPVTFGEQMALALLGAACLILRPGPDLASSKPARRTLWAFATTAAAALLLSQTRGALLAFIAGTASVCWFLPRMRRPLLAVIFAALAAFLLTDTLRYHKPTWMRLSEPLPPRGALIAGPMMRLTLWKVAWLMGKDHPWTGVGPNNYRTALPSYLDATFEDKQRSWGSAHNLFFHHFAERGLLGLSATLFLIGTLIFRSYRRARESPDFPNLWALSASVAFAVMNLTEVALETEILWMLVFFIWLWTERSHAARVSTSAADRMNNICR